MDISHIATTLTDQKKVIVIAGPTASGKTALSLRLAQCLPCEIISADSRQIYRFLDIGTAKPTREELQQVTHHFIDHLNPDENFSAGLFAQEASELVKSLFRQKKIPLIVGGTGLYIKALCEGFISEESDSFSLPEQQRVRTSLEQELQTDGIDSLYAKLLECDPPSARLYSDKNPRRIIRALEFFSLNNTPFSEAQKRDTKRPEFSNITFCINEERSLLYDRINRRTEEMWNSGLVEETERVLEMGFSPSLNSLNTVGYKETIAFIKGEISAPEAINLIAQHTRNYAKRQVTWFKKIDGMIPIEKDITPLELLNLIALQA